MTSSHDLTPEYEAPEELDTAVVDNALARAAELLEEINPSEPEVY